MRDLDANKDEKLTREETVNGFARWFDNWNKASFDALTNDQLRDAINQAFTPQPPGPPPAPPGERNSP